MEIKMKKEKAMDKQMNEVSSSSVAAQNCSFQRSWKQSEKNSTETSMPHLFPET